MAFKVMKFGGTSVGSAARMKAVADLITAEPGKKIVVLSAMSGTTNSLVKITDLFRRNAKSDGFIVVDTLEQQYSTTIENLYRSPELRQQASEKVKAIFSSIRDFGNDVLTSFEEKAILAQGEILSTTLFHLYLVEQDINCGFLCALDFMKINEDEEPDQKYIEHNLRSLLNEGKDLYLTQGYICRNNFGHIDNLKRGGSDYSASLIGAAVDASEIQIWTDIDGMHNNDPRIVPNTFPVAELSFDEAAELAYFGAKILHPSTVLPAKVKGIPVRLLNTMDPKARGTIITATSSGNNIKAVAAKDDIVAIKIKSSRMLLAYGFLRSVFEVFERYRTSIDMITTSEVAVSVTIDSDVHLEEIIKDLQQFGSVEVDRDQAIICIVGDFLEDKPGYALRVFSSLNKIPIRMISYGGSKNNISVVVNSGHKKDALIALNEGLFNHQLLPQNV